MSLTKEQYEDRFSHIALHEAEHSFESGNLAVASDLAWKAAKFEAKSLARRKGLKCESLRDIWRILSSTAELMDSEGESRVYSADWAMSLRTNAGEDWMTDDFVEEGLQEVRKLVQKLEEL